MSRATKIVFALVAVAVLAIGGVFAYIYWIRADAPAALDNSDLDAALGVDTVPAAGDAATTDAPVTTGDTGATVTDATGTWNISSDSTLGYRVSEVLFGVDTEGAGRTNQVTGSLVIDGTTATSADFTVDVASITSDDDRRDGQFRGRIMSTDQFPTATFKLTQPIDFGSIPAAGDSVTASATGDLTLRGVTKSVTFDLTAKLENGRIGVLGNIPISFSDYSIPDPSNQAATVKDNGLLEFVLVFDKA